MPAYAPCRATDLACSGFRYWALGHIHKRSAAEGSCSIVMPGIPQGRDAGESGPKSVTLASVMDDGTIIVAERIVSVAQFEHVLVDASRAETWSDLVTRVETALGEAADRSKSDHVVARLAPRVRRRWRGRSGVTQIFCTLKPRADPRRSGTSGSKKSKRTAGGRHPTHAATARSRRRAQTDDERGRRRLGSVPRRGKRHR